MRFIKCCTLILLGLIYIHSAIANMTQQKIIMSYWSNGKRYRPYPISGTNNDLLGKINHINVLAYAFFQVKNNGDVYFSQPGIDLSKSDFIYFCKTHHFACPNTQAKTLLGNFDAFSKLNNKQRDLKKIISIGGAGSERSFLNAINHPTHFIKSVTSIIKAYQLNGVDLDFELYSLFTKNQAQRYATLIKNLRKKLGKKYFISIEVPADSETLKSMGRENWHVIANNAYVSIMGYEFHSYLYPPYYTANNSNLYSDPNEPNIKGFYHISDDQAVKYISYLGVPVNKIILGFPAYFQAYGEVNAINHGLYQPFNSRKTPSFDYGKGKGSYRLTQNLLKNGFISHEILMNGKVSAVFAYNIKNKQWISYENKQSVAAKAQYVEKNYLAGVMMWNIKQDLPANNPNSLLRSVYDTLNDYLVLPH